VCQGRAAAPRPPPAPVDGGPPKPGEWLFTTREGAERDLTDELYLAKVRDARIVAPALVAAARAPRPNGRVELTFARQGFPILRLLDAASPAELGLAGGTVLADQLRGTHAYALHVWVPDATETNRLAGHARDVHEAAAQVIEQRIPAATAVDTRDAGVEPIPVAQIAVLGPWRAAVGIIASDRALSLAPGGRLRAKVAGDLPSRAARKLTEAFAWLGIAPEPGELTVDLGAAPGGWTWVLLERRARVIAVDPGRLRPELLGRRGLTYVPGNAFEFEPDEPADWLFCDMAFRPLEVARLLARWGQRRWAALLVANFKLPMKRKAETVRELVAVLESGGWRSVRARQLYHDRDEITVTARLV
jgi:23S rRNA (cytidine2498-2'-O)-methyltransferase